MNNPLFGTGELDKITHSVLQLFHKHNVPCKGVDDIYIMTQHCFPFAQNTQSQIRDRVVDRIGMPVESKTPFIYVARTHGSYIPFGIGTTLFEARNRPEIKYAVSRFTLYDHGDTTFAFVPKGQLYRTVKHLKSQHKKSIKPIPAPILDQETIDLVYDNTVRLYRQRRQFKKYGSRLRRGIILSGKPGNGKTLLCRWIESLCRYHGIPFDQHSGGAVASSITNQDELQDMFCADGVNFFDDLDLSLLNREEGNRTGTTSILSAMDGINNYDSNSIRVITTNESLDTIEEAFLRPGRIDIQIEIKLPTPELKQRFVVERWGSEINEYLTTTNKLKELMDYCDPFSFAEMEGLKTFLVTNKVYHDKWDLDLAIESFEKHRQEISHNTKTGKRRKPGSKKPLGFQNV